MRRTLDQLLSVIPWDDVDGTYESGANLPPLFRVVAAPKQSKSSAKARAKAWQDIWGALYHQDDIWTASIASIPVLAFIAAHGATLSDRRAAAELAGAIEMWTRARDVARMPAPVRRLLPSARATLKRLAKSLLGTSRRSQELEASLLALQGKRREARRLYVRAQIGEDESDDEEDDREVVATFRLKSGRERGLIYFLDEDGDIGVRRNVKGGVKSEKVLTLGVKRDPRFIYQVEGSRVLRARMGT